MPVDGKQVPPSLLRTLTLLPTLAIVVGSVIGSGIFVMSPSMLRSVQGAPLLILVWILAGVMTLFGAMTQSELASRMPRTGGLYEYLKEIYGKEVGFFYGWANFMIAGSGAIAAISFMFGSYLQELTPLYRLPKEWEEYGVALPFLGKIFPFADFGVKCVGASVIVFLTALNVRGIKLGALVQSISASSKLILISGLLGVAFLLGSQIGSTRHFFESGDPVQTGIHGWGLVSALTLAMSGAFWAYDGWGNVAYIAGEVKEPGTTIPRAIIFGTLIVIGVYVSLNLSYLYILPYQKIASVSNDRVASAVVAEVLGKSGGVLVAILIMLSSFDCTNSSILTNGRVYYAMAEQGLFWKRAAAIHPRYRTPHISLIAQGTWAIILLMSGSYDLITSMYVFVNWLLYFLMAVGVFIVRRRTNSDAQPSFTMPGYPWIPLTFTVFSLAYVGMTLWADISAYRHGGAPMIKSLMGLALVSTGLPFYFWLRRRGGLAA